jgi:hypothetical protein
MAATASSDSERGKTLRRTHPEASSWTSKVPTCRRLRRCKNANFERLISKFPPSGIRNAIDSCASRLQHSMVMDWACNAGGILVARNRFAVVHHCPIAESKPIFQLQAPCFPLGHRCLPVRASMHWGWGPPNVRRCLLAAVLAVFGNSRIRSLLEACPEQSGWGQLLSSVSENNREDLRRRGTTHIQKVFR